MNSKRPQRRELVNLEVPEKGICEVTGAERWRRWLAENRSGFEAFARFVEEAGVFNEDDREW